jgi:hypothetical protein
MAIQPLPGDRHILFAPVIDICAALTEFGLDVDPLLAPVAEMAECLHFALFSGGKFTDDQSLGGSERPVLHEVRPAVMKGRRGNASGTCLSSNATDQDGRA